MVGSEPWKNRIAKKKKKKEKLIHKREKGRVVYNFLVVLFLQREAADLRGKYAL